MYIPSLYQEPDVNVALNLVEELRLGSLVSTGSQLTVSHLPFMVDRTRGNNGTLIGHVARANSQWRDLERDPEVLVTFFGPNAYISPSWYSVRPKAPTWNFVAVHVYGRSRLIHDVGQLTEMVKDLSSLMEPAQSGWQIGHLDKSYIDKWVPEVVGFEIEITKIETQIRLSQENKDKDLVHVHEQLSNGTEKQREVASLMGRFSFRNRSIKPANNE